MLPRIAVISILVALLPACGRGPARSPQTREYLLQLCGRIDQLDRGLLQVSRPKAPQIPILSGETEEAQAAALRKFSNQLGPYYTAARETVKRVLAICDDAQSKAKGLDSKGTDAGAVYMGLRYASLIDSRQNVALLLEAQIDLWQGGLNKGFVPKFALKVTDAGIEALLTPTCMAENIPELQPAPEEASELVPQDMDVVVAIARWRRAAIADSQARSYLFADLRAEYPGDDWSFLAPKAPGTP